jgi:hypothetical protein
VTPRCLGSEPDRVAAQRSRRLDPPIPVLDGRGFLGGWWFLPGPWLEPGFREKGFARLPERITLAKQLIDASTRSSGPSPR